MSGLDFLSAALATGAVARSPMERMARAAGATFEVRDGWNVATHYGSLEREAALARRAVGWADLSHVGKLEIQGDVREPEHGDEVRWCALTPTRALAIGDVSALRERARDAALDVSTTFAALVLVGPLARETFARFCALDLRDAITPIGSVRPGSIARQPGILIREAEQRFLFLFGAATGQYMWSVVEDAARHLGGGPIGIDALDALHAGRREELRSRA